MSSSEDRWYINNVSRIDDSVVDPFRGAEAIGIGR